MKNGGGGGGEKLAVVGPCARSCRESSRCFRVKKLSEEDYNPIGRGWEIAQESSFFGREGRREGQEKKRRDDFVVDLNPPPSPSLPLYLASSPACLIYHPDFLRKLINSVV